MKKRCFLILGAESSGTRMLTQSFISAGVWGDGDHWQRLDDLELDIELIGEDVVYRKSLPFVTTEGDVWVDISATAERFGKAGFHVVIIGIMRETSFVVDSQLRDNQHSSSVDEAMQKIQRASRLVNDYADEVLEYSTFVDSEEYRNAMFQELGLPPPNLYYYNANDKYR